MHNLLLGLVMFHFRNILGIDSSADTQRRKGDTRIATPKEMERARKTFMSTPSAGKLGALRVPVLAALCLENHINVVSANSHKGVRKADLVRSLLAQPRTSMDEEITNVDPTDNNFLQLVGEEYIQECEVVPPAVEDNDVWAQVTKSELEQIRASLVSVIRPTWHCGPPLNLGEPAHGKLKADQWQSCIEFDLPVALVRTWAPRAEDKEPSRRQKLLEATMFPAIAIRWGSSHRTSKYHADNYMKYMHAYLVNLRDLFPDMPFRPNHHVALHIGEFFQRYGPMHGWWMFPFERVIGILQRTNTNYKIGQLETTMLESFCAASNVKAFIQQPECPSILKESSSLLEECWGQYNKGTLMTDIRTLAGEQIPDKKLKRSEIAWNKQEQLSEELRSTLLAMHKELVYELPNWTCPDAAFFHPRHTICQLRYANQQTSKRDSTMFFKPLRSNFLVPGVIQEIFSVPIKHTKDDYTEIYFLAIQKFKACSSEDDPFEKYPDFGASIWSEELADLDIIPSSQTICHAIWQPWRKGTTVGTTVMKPLDRVR
ncbi:hypothetical protein BJ138DRAFT_1019721 [Hygrophoropsis aurantiaca]|uniref:Uncharacterized protein n=1 Tax=Hygrophoropsis aurantiaca TaxID=72124 RepID=A0ACB7ZTH0_9AGAM|nr:hypothetical protein BJ138DRAFT_1019721 [Hygrophoropsis aurantiaca]